jgi:hypothetical protein
MLTRGILGPSSALAYPEERRLLILEGLKCFIEKLLNIGRPSRRVAERLTRPRRRATAPE